jgi:hypothetical protein
MLTTVGKWNSDRFHQAGATPHTSSAIFHFIHDVFEEIVLWNLHPALFEEGFSWSPTTPDINRCDYIPWEYLNDNYGTEN